jgi:hypothetical protein
MLGETAMGECIFSDALRRLTAQFGAHGLGAVFGITPIFCAKAMKRGSSL